LCDCKLRTLVKHRAIALLTFAAVYCLWFLVSFSVLQAGLIFTTGEAFFNIAIPAAVLFFIVLASILTAIFVVYGEWYLQNLPGHRLFCISFVLAVGVGLFIFVRQTGNIRSIVFIIGSANLLVFANLIGTWIVTPLKRPAELVPVCIVMSLADLFSLTSGPTKRIAGSIEMYYEGAMEGQPPAWDFLLVKIVVPGFDKLLPVFGVSDWIMVAFLSAAVVKFGMNDNLAGKSLGDMVKNGRLSVYLPVAALGLATAILVAQVFCVFLPALPIIALFFLTYILIRYPQARRLERYDWILMLLFSGVMVSLLAIY